MEQNNKGIISFYACFFLAFFYACAWPFYVFFFSYRLAYANILLVNINLIQIYLASSDAM